MTYCVYYTLEENVGDDDICLRAYRKEFVDCGDMLKYCEQLRKRKRDGELISFITSAHEDENSVGEQGVEGPPMGYDWKKRRK